MITERASGSYLAMRVTILGGREVVSTLWTLGVVTETARAVSKRVS
jgi:hypothetical protein